MRALRVAGIRDERLLEAVRTTLRAGFVPAGQVAAAYRDVPVAIGQGQVTAQLSLSAMMIESLALGGSEHVLEVGTGLGFQTALLARLAADVVSSEMRPDIARQARVNLSRQGVGNVELRVGEGSGGVPDWSPYDAVLVFNDRSSRFFRRVRPSVSYAVLRACM
ncbi:methyltransferase domain-containing protein [Streptomyces sp. NPDC005202]|uniref:protein-L-isoaspartate O-methyltransferase family protein n=1 Tax=Streptomyces sp. NPDC005202 TaxID=3157021 RepID=UPI0033A8DA2C